MANGFIFGGGTGVTYEQLQRQRALAESLAKQRAGRAPQNVGEGLRSLGQGILAGALSRRTEREEKAQREKFQENLANVLGGGADIAQLGDLAASPYASPGQQIVLQEALKRRLAPPKAAAPVRGVEVGGNLVNPITGEIIYQGTQPQHRVLSESETTKLGLPPGAYQESPEGKITAIGGGGQTINIQTPGGDDILELDKKTGQALVVDPESPTGMKWVDIPGGKGAKREETAIEQGDFMLGNIDALLADPGLDYAVGKTGAVTERMGAFAPEAARARSRIEQIQGQTFLQAFERLKGSGQITEIEGRKAEQAIARLNTDLSPDDFRAALNDLRGVVQTGLARAGAPGAQDTRAMSDEDLLNLYGGQ